jgi:tRNA pseudouridine38-40 synthase
VERTLHLDRLRVTVAYDGRPFSGWQSQPNQNGVQDHLNRAFRVLDPASAKLHGAGRTDAGVHALAQIAHVDVSHGRFPVATWITAVNSHLPAEIRVLRCVIVSPRFHAQFSAKGKIYHYHIWNHPILDPLEIGRSWHVPFPLDLDLMSRAAQLLSGRHDFASFAANRGKPPESTVRIMHAIKIRRTRRLIRLLFDGNGFLYRMVRMLVGAIVRVAAEREPPDWIEQLLHRPGEKKASFTAPAAGLYLAKVKY